MWGACMHPCKPTLLSFTQQARCLSTLFTHHQQRAPVQPRQHLLHLGLLTAGGAARAASKMGDLDRDTLFKKMRSRAENKVRADIGLIVASGHPSHPAQFSTLLKYLIYCLQVCFDCPAKNPTWSSAPFVSVLPAACSHSTILLLCCTSFHQQLS